MKIPVQSLPEGVQVLLHTTGGENHPVPTGQFRNTSEAEVMDMDWLEQVWRRPPR